MSDSGEKKSTKEGGDSEKVVEEVEFPYWMKLPKKQCEEMARSLKRTSEKLFESPNKDQDPSLLLLGSCFLYARLTLLTESRMLGLLPFFGQCREKFKAQSRADTCYAFELLYCFVLWLETHSSLGSLEAERAYIHEESRLDTV